jgi:hypothetical protein
MTSTLSFRSRRNWRTASAPVLAASTRLKATEVDNPAMDNPAVDNLAIDSPTTMMDRKAAHVAAPRRVRRAAKGTPAP